MTVRRPHVLEATSIALDWEISEADHFNVPRIDLVFATPPQSAGTVSVIKDSVSGAAYDSTVRTYNPVGLSSIAIEGLQGFVMGDKIRVVYDNPDNVSITGSASLELTHVAPGLAEGGLTADGGTIRSLQTKYADYYHVSLGSADPGASGATWVPADSNQLEGYRLNAATENITDSVDIHASWDQAFNPEVEVVFTVNVDNSLGAAPDTVDLQFVATYAQAGDSVVKTQTVLESVVVGACDQYTIFKAEVELDRNAVDNPIDPGDIVNVVISCPATGDVTDIVINEAAFYYPTTHVGRELAYV